MLERVSGLFFGPLWMVRLKVSDGLALALLICERNPKSRKLLSRFAPDNLWRRQIYKKMAASVALRLILTVDELLLGRRRFSYHSRVKAIQKMSVLRTHLDGLP